MPTNRLLAALAALALVAAAAGPAPAGAPQSGGLAMHGEPALPPDFAHLPYVFPDAPRGGRMTLGLLGTFDSLNPYVVRGVAPDAAPRYVLESLMARSFDEPFTLYPLVARAHTIPPDRGFVVFHLDERARFADGAPLTAHDVAFSFDLLRRFGKPYHRSSFGQVRAVEVEAPHRIRFDLAGVEDRELPLLLALMPIFAAHATDAERFEETTLKPPLGSGPYAIAEVRPGERIVLKRRGDWWGEDLPVNRGRFNLDEVRYDFYRDANTLFEAFKVGLYDVRTETDPGRWVHGYDIPALREGRILREEIPIEAPRGMTGFVFNTRRGVFADVRVREALGALFDFEWVNRNLFYGVMRRSGSYFEGADLTARGRPADARERALLAPFPGAVREDVMEGRWAPPVSDGSGRDRDLARRALDLLGEAGWALDGEALRHRESGAPLAFELLVVSRQQERLALNYAHALARIGVVARVRLVDDVQFWRRLGTFDFDMIQWTWPVSPSPGNEQRNRWGAEAAERGGSLNYAGARSPAIDALIDAMLAAQTREEFSAAVRALDRVLLSGFYVVPLFHIPVHWLAYEAGLRRPPSTPLFGPSLDTWWRERNRAVDSP